MASTILSFSSSPSFLASNRAGSSPLRSINGPCSVFLPSRPAKLSALRARAAGENEGNAAPQPDTQPTPEEKPLDMTSFGVRVQDEESEIKIWVVMPGLSKDDMTVSNDHGFVYVGGEQKKKEGGAQGSWIGKSNISYHTEHSLPDNCEKVKAELKDGFVLISSPKTKESQVPDIDIQ